MHVEPKRSCSAAPIATAATRCVRRDRMAKPLQHADNKSGGRHWSAGYQGVDGPGACAARAFRITSRRQRQIQQRGYTAAAAANRPEFVRFINPGDLPRRARRACGACHLPLVEANEKSLMSNSGDVLGRSVVQQRHSPVQTLSILGEAYTKDGLPATIDSQPKLPMRISTMTDMGILPKPDCRCHRGKRFTPVADVFRVFERGGKQSSAALFPEIGLPDESRRRSRSSKSPDVPDIKSIQSRTGNRQSRRDSGAQHPRRRVLTIRTLWMMGTNDQPGRLSLVGLFIACHTDLRERSRCRTHSGRLSRNSATHGHVAARVAIRPFRANEIRSSAASTSSRAPFRRQPVHDLPHAPAECMFINSDATATRCGTTNRTRRSMWPAKQKYPTADEEQRQDSRSQSRGSGDRAATGATSTFLKDVSSLLNPTLEGHAVRRLPRPRLELPRASTSATGIASCWTCSTRTSRSSPTTTRTSSKKAVHLSVDPRRRRHAACVDCHFSQDAHGDGHI